MNRIPLIAGNWKMYKTTSEAQSFISALGKEIATTSRLVCLAVPFTSIEAAVEAATSTPMTIGAQNMHDQIEGAFTGEISARMLNGSGASFVLLGHSERRQYFGESNALICRKLQLALQEGIIPFLCIGELLKDRESGNYEKVLKSQLEECLQGISSAQAAQLVIAYEPVWAIGTGKTATPEIAQAVHYYIRQWLEGRFGEGYAEKISLLYGGSVKPDNIASLMEQMDIDGVLVGGASLDVKSFSKIVNYI